MGAVLHLLTGSDPSLALPVIEQQSREPGTVVTVVRLDATDGPLPPGVSVRRIGRDLTYSELLDLIFESDQVIAW